MRTAVLFEKGETAINGAVALGSLRRLNPDSEADKRWLNATGIAECRNNVVVLVAQGHLLEFPEPDEVDPKRWGGAWRYEQLPISPHENELKLVPVRDEKRSDRFARSRLKLIGDQLKSADRVVIATDTDRAGEAIGHNILDYLKWHGRVQRLWLKDTTPENFDKFWREMENDRDSAARYEPFAWAERGRAYEDYTNGMTGSRGSNLRLKPKEFARDPINAGNVMSPLVGLIVSREDKIRTFVPRDYWVVEAKVGLPTGKTLDMAYQPRDEETRLWRKEDAEAIVAAATGLSAPLHVETREEKVGPPRPFNTSGLQKAAGAVFRFKPSTTQKIVEKLRERGFLTYPRTPSQFYPEDRIGQLNGVAEKLAANFTELSDAAAKVASAPTMRMGSRYNAAKTTSHHAIMPTAKVPRPGDLSDDERKIYTLVARNYLAQHLPDAVDLKTTIALEVPLSGGIQERIGDKIDLKAIGTIEKSPGWRAADNRTGGKDSRLPPVKNGDIGQVQQVAAGARRTEPPSRFKQTEITGVMSRLIDHIDDMVDDPAERKRLRLALTTANPDEPKGLGSPATQAAIVDKVIHDGLITVDDKGYLIPTAKGEIKVAGWRSHYPSQVDPVSRAQTESDLLAIEEAGSPAKARDLYHAFCHDARQRAVAITEHLRDATPVIPGHVTVERSVSGKMALAAKAAAKRSGVKLSADILKDFEATRAFLDNNQEPEESRGKPTPQQLETIRRNAAPLGHELKEGWEELLNRKSASSLIDKMMQARNKFQRLDGKPIPASEAQIKAVASKAARLGVTPPDGGKEGLSFKQASDFLDDGNSARKSPGSRGTTRPGGRQFGGRSRGNER